MMDKVVCLLTLFSVWIRGLSCKNQYSRTVSYEGEVLIKCSSLERSVVQGLLESDVVDVWHVGEGGSVDFRVSSEQFQRMKGDLPGCREVGSVEDIVRREEQQRAMQNEEFEKEWFEDYHPYTEIVEWWSKLAEDNPDLVKFEESIGKSVEGRDQPAVHITASVEPDVKKLYFQCLIHAREWISGAVCMYVADGIVQRFNDGDKEATELLNCVKIIIVPIVNPDGYEYTWTNDRLWRKNRRPPPEGRRCFGVDLNRNYDVHWGKRWSPSDHCDLNYCGPSPASEPETQNIVNYFRHQGSIVGSIDWHSYGQFILRPYGWTHYDSPDEHRLRKLANQISEDIFEAGGQLYDSRRAFDNFSGSAMDWFYSDDANSNSPYRAASFTIELRDMGEHEFLLPPQEIIPTGKEVLSAVIKFGLAIQETPIPNPKSNHNF